jgi:hypothetical protein
MAEWKQSSVGLSSRCEVGITLQCPLDMKLDGSRAGLEVTARSRLGAPPESNTGYPARRSLQRNYEVCNIIALLYCTLPNLRHAMSGRQHKNRFCCLARSTFGSSCMMVFVFGAWKALSTLVSLVIPRFKTGLNHAKSSSLYSFLQCCNVF